MLYEVLSTLAGNGKKEGRCWKFPSPFREEHDPSFAVYENDTWYDFGSGEGGDTVEFFRKYYNCSFKEAVAEMEAWIAHLGIEVKPTSIIRKDPKKNYSIRIKQWQFDQDLFFGIVVPKRTGVFRIIYNGSEYAAFPCPGKNKIEGIECKRIKGTGPEKLSLFKKTIWFFERGDKDSVLVTESIRDCLAGSIIKVGNYSLLSLNGISNAQKGINFLSKVVKPKKIFIALDNDSHGRGQITQKEMTEKLQSTGLCVEDWSTNYSIHGLKDFYRLFQTFLR